MDRDEVLEVFRSHNAMLDGHFLLSSGKHSPQYLQCALVLSDPAAAVGYLLRYPQDHTTIIEAVNGGQTLPRKLRWKWAESGVYVYQPPDYQWSTPMCADKTEPDPYPNDVHENLRIDGQPWLWHKNFCNSPVKYKND